MFSLCLPGAPTIHMNGSQPVLKNERTHTLINGNIHTDVKKRPSGLFMYINPLEGTDHSRKNLSHVSDHHDHELTIHFVGAELSHEQLL